MEPARKALWFVESHLRNGLGLEQVAQACHVSPFHMARAFASAVGLPLMRYVRARRLSEAARELADGAADILGVALEAGYGSHEAFTRAFREQFALTPEQVRAQGHVGNLVLQEPIIMSTAPTTELTPPRFETRPPRRLAGLLQRHACSSPAGIPEQWQRFAAHLAALPPAWTRAAYGVCTNFDETGNFDYLCGIELPPDGAVPRGLQVITLPQQRYAVFHHAGHVAGLRGTIDAVWNLGLPAAGCEAVEGAMLERYGPDFNPHTGLGGVEIWIPIKP